MKKTILAFALLTAFVSCKDQAADPKGEVEEEKVQLSKVKTSLLNKNQIKVSGSDFELVYDVSGKKLEKINQKFELFSQTGQPVDTQQATYLIEYNTNNTIKSIQVVPDNSGKTFLVASKFNFTYSGSLLDSYQKEGSGAVLFEYDATGNIIKRKAGSSEHTYAYLNNGVTVAGGSSFEFGEYINPLSTMDKGLAMVLGNAFNGVGSEPVNVYSKFLTKVNDPGIVPNSPPSPSTYQFTVSESKEKYPLKAEIVHSFQLSPGNTLTSVMEYQYKNL